MKTVAVTGLSGVVGQILAQSAPSEIQLIDLFHVSRKNEDRFHKHIDLLSEDSVKRTLDVLHPDVLIQLAAITHIDTCEKDKKYGKEGIVWKINVVGQKYITTYCKKNFIPLIYLSTECVFDGRKPFYDEHDKKHPKNWYGLSKHEAEEYVLSSGVHGTIIRTVMAYHNHDQEKTMFGRFLSMLKQHKKLRVVSNQQCSPTYTFDIARSIWKAVQKNSSGIFHITPGVSLSPYDFCTMLANHYHFDSSFIKPTTMDSFFGTERAALRLVHSCLSQTYSNKRLGIVPRKPDEVIAMNGKGL